jgi:hypothetical protein
MSFSRQASPHPLGKCDTELKTQVPEQLRDELTALAIAGCRGTRGRQIAMKTAIASTSIDAYYQRIVTPGVELTQIDSVVAYVVQHPCCTRRQIAAHFKRLNPNCPLAQEARVAARVNAAIKQQLIDESTAPVFDAVTHAKAFPLYPHDYKPQADLFFARSPLHDAGVHPEGV